MNKIADCSNCLRQWRFFSPSFEQSVFWNVEISMSWKRLHSSQSMKKTLTMCLDSVYFIENWKLIVKNNKKIIFKLLFTLQTLFVCLNAPFMEHERFMNSANSARNASQKKKDKIKWMKTQTQPYSILGNFLEMFFLEHWSSI